MTGFVLMAASLAIAATEAVLATAPTVIYASPLSKLEHGFDGLDHE